MTTKTKTRSIEVELDIAAPPDAVWKALTEPDELSRWFPLKARVEPGEGGAIALSWGEGLEGENRIQVWEPGRRLQTGWFATTEAFGSPTDQKSSQVFQDEPEAVKELVVDTTLEGRGGDTTLRLVHSGFQTDARWDDEYDGHRRGWIFELRSLRNYLEHHRGEARHVVWVRAPLEGDIRAAWDRLMSPQALLAEGNVSALAPGDRYQATTVHGERLEGEVVLNSPPLEFAGTVENLGRSLMRCGVEPSCFGSPVIHFWMSGWGDAGAEAIHGVERAWADTLRVVAEG